MKEIENQIAEILVQVYGDSINENYAPTMEDIKEVAEKAAKQIVNIISKK